MWRVIAASKECDVFVRVSPNPTMLGQGRACQRYEKMTVTENMGHCHSSQRLIK